MYSIETAMDSMADHGNHFALQRFLQTCPHAYIGYSEYALSEVGRGNNSAASRIAAFVEGNVGVIDQSIDIETQAHLNDTLSRAQDILFAREFPLTYSITKSASEYNFPLGSIDRFNSAPIVDRILLSPNRTIGRISSLINQGKVEMYAGIKPIRAAAIEELRRHHWGEQLGVTGGFTEIHDRLEKFEEGLKDESISLSDISLFQKSIYERYDRLRARVFFHDDREMGSFVGALRIDWGLLVKPVLQRLGLGDRMDFYMSEWIYRENGEVETRELRDHDFPRNIHSYYENIRSRLGGKDIAYAALHAHLPIRIHGHKAICVELQLAPKYMSSMHHLAERIYKQDKPGLSHVAPELIRLARQKAGHLT